MISPIKQQHGLLSKRAQFGPKHKGKPAHRELPLNPILELLVVQSFQSYNHTVVATEVGKSQFVHACNKVWKLVVRCQAIGSH